MKIQDNVLDIFGDGTFKEQEVKIKTAKFETNAASGYFKEFLTEKGYAEHLGFKEVERKRYGKVKYLTLYNKIIETKFCIWQAMKDNDTGKANLWVGEKYREGVGGIIMGDRSIPNHYDFFGIIIVPKNFKEGMSLKDCSFVDYLLIPLEDFIKLAQDTFDKTGKIDCLYINKEIRNQFNFDTVMESAE